MSTTPANTGATPINITVHTLQAVRLTLDASAFETVADIQAHIQKQTGLHPRLHRLLYEGRVLDKREAVAAALRDGGCVFTLLTPPDTMSVLLEPNTGVRTPAWERLVVQMMPQETIATLKLRLAIAVKRTETNAGVFWRPLLSPDDVCLFKDGVELDDDGGTMEGCGIGMASVLQWQERGRDDPAADRATEPLHTGLTKLSLV